MTYSESSEARGTRLSAAKQKLLHEWRQGKELKIAEVPDIPQQQEGEATELSFGQQRLWFLDQLEPGSSVYILSEAFHLRGYLDVAVLERCLNEIVRRHEVLHTNFVMVEGQPQQIIHDAAQQGLVIQVHELSHLSLNRRNAQAQKLIFEERQQPFDLGHDCLVRVGLLRMSTTEHILLLTMHHIVSDGWSMGVLQSELSVLYTAFRQGLPSPLPELSLQYADYAIWQRQHLQGAALDASLSYWRERLADLSTLTLPTDFPRPAAQTFRGSHILFTLDTQLVHRLEAVGRQSEATLFMTMLTAFQVLLLRYSGQQDIVVGTPIANRTHSQTETLIGCFINMLVLRTNFSGTPGFREALQQVRRRALEAYMHQDVPFEKLVEDLQPERDLKRHPLFQVLFILQNAPGERPELLDLEHSYLEVESGIARFDLTLELIHTPDGLKGRIEYMTDLFEVATIERMAERFQILLRGIVDNPERCVGELPILAESEQRRLLKAWSGAQENIPHVSIVRQFEAQVARTPDVIALVFEQQHITYRELNQRANRLASALRKRGVGPAVLVGIYMERSVEMMIGLLSILKAGGAYLPLDPTYPEERLTFMLEDAQVSVLLTQSWLQKNFLSLDMQYTCLHVDQDSFVSENEANHTDVQHGENLAYVMYTSGSTGNPKGVMVTQRNVENFFAAMKQILGGQEAGSWLALTSISFDISVLELFWTLTCGFRVIVQSDRENWLLHQKEFEYTGDASELDYSIAAQISRHDITHLQCTPTLAGSLVQDEATCRVLGGLRELLLGGEALSSELADQLAQIVSGKLRNMYGPTECTIWSSTQALDGEEERVTLGRPIFNTQFYVLDSNMQLVPPGIIGELYIGGVSLARGYLRRPELTAERFIPNPFSDRPGGRLYKTGDLVRSLADNTFEFQGRYDQQVKLRGYRIELGEIEAALRTHPAIRDAAVFTRGENAHDTYLVAYLLLHESCPSDDVLRSFLLKYLPIYMLPSYFVPMDSFPVTPNGKLDRLAFPEPETQVGVTRTEPYVAPRTTIEVVLAEIWSEILDKERVSVYDSFFAAGGHSLQATALTARIREALHVDLPLRSLFESPTIAALAQEIILHEQQKMGTVHDDNMLSTVIPDLQQRYQPFPLTDLQEAYWVGRNDLFELGNIATHNYIEQAYTELDIDCFIAAFRRVIERHDMLRAIVLSDGQQQIFQEVPPYEPRILDLRTCTPEDAEEKIQEIRQYMSHQIHVSDQWPLFEMRISLLDQHVLVHWSIDALISDGWSLTIIYRDLARFYHDPEVRLPVLELSFRDYVLGERALRATTPYQRDLAYWNDRIAELPTAPALPLAKNAMSIMQPQFVRRSSQLSVADWQRLKALAARAHLTPSSVLLTAFADVLAYWSQQRHFTLNLTLFNRLPLHAGVNEIVGDFTSLTLLEIDQRSAETFLERALRVQKRLWQDMEYRLVSGVHVLRELAKRDSRGQQALMPVVFTSMLGLQRGRQQQEAALSGQVVYSVSQTPQVWLDHQVFEQDGILYWSWDAIEELFPSGLLDAMFAAYETQLKRLVSEDTNWQDALECLLPDKQQELRQRVNATEGQMPSGLLHTWVACQVQKRPDALAVITSQRRFTYRQIWQQATRTGYWLRQHGAQPTMLVGVVMEKGWEQVVAVLGVLIAGAAYLPLEAGLPAERMRLLLQQGAVSLVLTQSSFEEKLDWPADIKRLCVDKDQELAAWPDDDLEPIQNPDDLAYVIYTSGSTGLPKGVMIEHRSVLNTIVDLNERFKVGPEDRVLTLSSLSFDLSVYDIFGLLIAGGTIVLPDVEDLRDPARWLAFLRKEHISVWNTVPALMELLVEYVEGLKQRLPESLRLVWLSGDWIPLSLPGRIKALSSTTEVISMGGATEASIWSIYYPIHKVEAQWASIPYGTPLRNQRFEVFNERMESCPIWVPGHLYIGGIGLARGYWRDEEKTSARFVTHPVSGERWYATGDLGRYLPDGTIEFLGRDDGQVKIQGYRIEIGEVETALLHSTGVQQAAVVMQGMRQGAKRLVAYVVPLVKQEAFSVEDMRTFLRTRLPDYMVPAQIVIVDRLPLTSNGKVDRDALMQADVEQFVVENEESEEVVPDSPESLLIIQLIADILGLESVDAKTNLMNVGATSLDIIRILNRLENVLHFRPSIASLIRSPNIGSLIKAYERFALQNQGTHLATVSGSISEDVSTASYRMPELNTVSASTRREEGSL